MRFALVDERGVVIAASRDLSALQREYGERARETFRPAVGGGLERDGITQWDFGDLPELVEGERDGARLQGYPALVDQRDRVAIQIFDSRSQAGQAHRAGLRRLFVLALSRQFKTLEKRLPGIGEMCLAYSMVAASPTAGPGPGAPEPSACEELKRDIVDLVAECSFLVEDTNLRTAADFEDTKARGRAALVDRAEEICALLADILRTHAGLRRRLSPTGLAGAPQVYEDVRKQLDHLVYRGFVRGTSMRWLTQLPRYLQAVNLRLERLANQPVRDAQRSAQVEPLWQDYLARLASERRPECRAGLADFHWLLEEFRVSLFAQELGTLFPVSGKRLEARWRELVGDPDGVCRP